MKTGTVEVVTQSYREHDGVHILSTLSRLRPGIKEAQWVYGIAKPLRQLSWKYPEWFVRTSKEYIDKRSKTEKRVVFAFLVEIHTPDAETAIKMIDHVISSGGKQPKPEVLEKPTGVKTIAELPDKEIIKPLAHVYSEDRNAREPSISRAGGYNLGAGVDYVVPPSGHK